MNRFIRGTLIFIFILVSILSVYIWHQWKSIVNSLKPNLEYELSEVTGAQISIGDLKAEIIPRAAIELRNVSITYPCKKQIKLERAYLMPSLAALLKKEIDITEVHLESPQATLKLVDGKLTIGSNSESIECTDTEPDKVTEVKPLPVTTRSEIEDGFKLNFNFREIVVNNGSLIIATPTKSYNLNEIKLTTQFSLQSEEFLLTLPKLELDLDKHRLQIDMEAVHWNSAVHSVSIEEGRISLGKSSLKFSLTSKENYEALTLLVSAAKQQLSNLTSVAKDLSSSKKIPQLTGELGFNINLKKGNNGFSLGGDVSIKDLSNQNKSVRINSLTLSDFNYWLTGTQNKFFETQYAFTGLNIADSKDQYQAAESKGSLRFSHDKAGGYIINGEANVVDFLYQDSQTKVDKVRAGLKEIEVTISKKTDVVAKVQVHNGTVNVTNDGVRVESVESVSAPITVEVPASGGYKVSGPVSVLKGKVNTLNRDLSEVSGTVDILISGPLKEFIAKELNATVMERKLLAKAHFLMEKPHYLVKFANLSIEEGNIGISGKLSREEDKRFEANIHAAMVKAENFFPLITKSTSAKLLGKMNTLQGKITGRMDAPLDSLKGEGSFMFSHPDIQSFSLSASLAKAVSKIPLVGYKVVPNEMLEKEMVDEAVGEFTIENKTVHFSDLMIRRTNYVLRGKGSMDFELNTDFTASVVFFEETFQSLGLGFDKLGRLLGKVGKISIPLFITGKIPDISINPDIATLAKDNSGFTLIGDTLSVIGDVGGGVIDIIRSPFRSKSTPEPEPTPKAAAVGTVHSNPRMLNKRN